MKKKVLGLVASVVLSAQLIMPSSVVQAAQTIYNNATGVHDGYNYELWKDNGTTSMTLTDGGTFSCSWSNINNALFRKGRKWDCTQTWQQLGNISVDYAVNYQPNGNSYLCVYGWTRSPLVEYYIVDSWGTWRPPGSSSKGQITVDGGTYDVYETTRVNQPSIDGNTTFQQYWSVRTTKRTSGTISVSEHFKAWERMGLKMGKMYEAALTVEGYQSSGQATVTKNNISFGGSVPSSQPQESVQPTPSIDTGSIANIPEGQYYIKNVNAGKYLQVKGNTAANAQNVEIGTGTGVAGQKWYLKNTGDGYVTLQSELGNYMLDIANGTNEDGANAQIYSAYSGDPQKFQVKSTSKDNVYTIVTKGSNGTKALDVASKSTADGANVQQWTFNGNANQQWIFEKVGSTPVVSEAPTPTPSQAAPSTAPSVQPSQSTGSTTGLPSGVTCTYSVTSDWGSGYQGQIVLKNGSSQTLNAWQLAFNYSNKITSLWGAELAGQTGNQVVVKAPSWDQNLAPGQSVAINFVAEGSSSVVPSGYSLK